jgi:predicted DNA-binding transcriptional regulator AlpA
MIASRLPIRRGLGREEAAVYVGVSPSYFDGLVEQRIMPQPRLLGSRIVWDIDELDLAFQRLPRKGEALPKLTADSWRDFR